MPKSIQISYSTIAAPKKGTLIVLVDDQGGVAFEIEKIVGKALIERILSVRDFKGKKFTCADAVCDGKKGFDRLLFVGIGNRDELHGDDWLKIGGVARAKAAHDSHVTVCLTAAGDPLKAASIEDFLSGFRLRDYTFDRYKTVASRNQKKKKGQKIIVQLEELERLETAITRADALSDAVVLARDLVNEPANILGPEEFAAAAQKLTKLGVKVEVLNEKDMKKLGMGALLGVSRGSRKPPFLVVMHWQGSKAKSKPLAFVGKGVVFDTGGISLKPGAGMEDMKGDMGGAAAVTGLMMALAARKAPVNVVGVIGLVENMPDGDAQRPGDIVTSMSGQTIEVINTDAEGRLVLADALWYTKEKYKPQLMINLATLTGAIMVALGTEYAGLFSNDDELAEKLYSAGTKSGEKVWRMPLNDAYDKIVDSKFADMRNSCGRHAGAITAAQFLKRFVGETPWAHLDIAGTAMGAPMNEYNQSWGSGYGVRLLERFVTDFYEA